MKTPRSIIDVAKWTVFLNKVISNVALTVYDAPILKVPAAEIQNVLGVVEDVVLEPLGLAGPRTENRMPGQCAPVIIIFVRGTTEAPNVGMIAGPPTFKVLREHIGETKLVVQGVPWAGLLSTYSKGGDPVGIKNMVTQVNSAVKECSGKGSKIVMAGYSQGALMTRAAIKQLPVEVMDKVSAIVLWGDPAKRANAKIPAPVPLLNGTSIPATGDKVKVMCHPLDAYCLNSDVFTPFHQVYFHYGKQDVVNFILQKTGFK